MSFVFYTHWFVKKGFAGCTYGPFIFIRPTKRGDVGLLEHEKVHAKQFWRNPFFGIPYFFSKTARLKYEAEAYRVQLTYNPERLDVFATLLATKYDLDITVEEARVALKSPT